MNIQPDMINLAFLGPVGWPELLILAFLGLLIFGKRLPEVGKSLGQGIVSFKKGLKGVQDDIEDQVNRNDDDEVDEPKRIESKTNVASPTKSPERDEAHS